MKRLLNIRLVMLALVIAGSLAAVVPAKGSPIHPPNSKHNNKRLLTKSQADPPIPFGPSTVTVVDMPVPPGLQNPPPPPTVTNPQVVPTAQPTQPTSTTTAAVPQVVTTVAPKTPPAATTSVSAAAPKLPPVCSNLPELSSIPATMFKNATTGTCSPWCLNHPDYVVPLPDRWSRANDGNCYFRGEDDYGLCKGDQYNLVRYSDVDSWLKNGYGMGIIVATTDLQYRLNCLISDLATYHYYDPSKYVFSGMYVQDGWPADSQQFSTPLPYPWSGWKPLYPLWVQKSTASQYVASQSTASILAYGMLWYDGNRYQTANQFVKYLRKNRTSWRSWKKSNPNFAAALVTHQTLLRRLKRR